jgi:uncharacterized membrane protein YfcA
VFQDTVPRLFKLGALGILAFQILDPESFRLGLPLRARSPWFAPMLSDPAVLAWSLLAAVCIGLAKSGFVGTSMISVVVLADLHGSKESVGFALPLLIAADLLAYPAFRKHGSWRAVWPLLAPALVGVAAGWLVLGKISDIAARRAIGACVLAMVALQALRKWRPAEYVRLADSGGFGLGAGVLGGFSTMLANAAGPVIQLYLIARRLPKMELLGIGARFFLAINLLKVPLNMNLALITPASLLGDLKLVPAVALGVFGGRWLVSRVPQRAFEWMVVLFAAVAGLRMLIW